jgi:hypothetical protein
MKMDAAAIHLRTGSEPSVLCTQSRGALLWGRLVACGRLLIGQLLRLHQDCGGSQLPRNAHV